VHTRRNVEIQDPTRSGRSLGAARAIVLGLVWLAAIPVTACVLAELSAPAPAAAQSPLPESRPASLVSLPISRPVPYMPTADNRAIAAVLSRLDSTAPAKPLEARTHETRPAAKSRHERSSLPAAASTVTDESLPQVYRGGLVIESQPEGARVYIDKRLAGVTPLMLHDLVAGSPSSGSKPTRTNPCRASCVWSLTNRHGSCFR
jgi:PEGA domain